MHADVWNAEMSIRGLMWGQRERSDGLNIHCFWSTVLCYYSKWDTKDFLSIIVWNVGIFFLVISLNNQQFCELWLPNYKRISPYWQPRNHFYSGYQVGVVLFSSTMITLMWMQCQIPKTEDSVSQHWLHVLCQPQNTNVAWALSVLRGFHTSLFKLNLLKQLTGMKELHLLNDDEEKGVYIFKTRSPQTRLKLTM